MKRSKIIKITTFSCFLLSLFIINSCKKNSLDLNSLKINSVSLSPASIPTFTSIKEVNSHIRYLAYGIASLTDTLFLSSSNDNDFVQGIENLILDGSDEISIAEVDNSINTNLFADYNSQASPQDFAQTLSNSINQNTPSPTSSNMSPRTWEMVPYNELGMSSFNLNTFSLYTLIRIPNFDVHLADGGRFNRPLLVVPAERDTFGDLLYPIVGYYVDPNTFSMDTVLYQTEDEIENDSRYYLWVVDVDMLPPTGSSSDVNCGGENAPVQNDGYCDGDCGEDFNNSPSDCDPNNVRKVWIDELQIIEDYKKNAVVQIINGWRVLWVDNLK